MAEKETLHQALSRIQQALKAPKGQMNNFGGYKYRSCEDIVEAVKPLLGDCALIIEDEIVLIGDRYYVKATATLTNGDPETGASGTAYAREPLEKKGMDVAQITGASSSYARKYALNGLFCIDDTKDADSTNTHDKEEKGSKPIKPPVSKEEEKFFEDMQPTDEEVIHWNENIEACRDLKELERIWNEIPPIIKEKLVKIKDEKKFKLT